MPNIGLSIYPAKVAIPPSQPAWSKVRVYSVHAAMNANRGKTTVIKSMWWRSRLPAPGVTPQADAGRCRGGIPPRQSLDDRIPAESVHGYPPANQTGLCPDFAGNMLWYGLCFPHLWGCCTMFRVKRRNMASIGWPLFQIQSSGIFDHLIAFNQCAFGTNR